MKTSRSPRRKKKVDPAPPRHREKFLLWAKSGDELWPTVKDRQWNIDLLDLAVREYVAEFLKGGGILPLATYLRECLDLIRFDHPQRSNVARTLCEALGFSGEFESAWQICVSEGYNKDPNNYLIYGVQSPTRTFDARQGYYFDQGQPPLTDIGRKQRGEIFPIVDSELQKFSDREGCNIFDYYLNLSAAIMQPCLDVPNLCLYSTPEGDDLFARGAFQTGILDAFRSRYLDALGPFEQQLEEMFGGATAFARARAHAVEDFKISLGYPFGQKIQFLQGHFYAVSTQALSRVYGGGKHSVTMPYLTQLVERCMATHIARIFRDSEDRFRQGLGLRGVGLGWISEAALYESIKRAFPHEVVVHHARPEWLGRQHLDIFFPHQNIAVEYQGAQHGRAISHFGGEVAFEVRKELDARKKELCYANGCTLIEVFPETPTDAVLNHIRGIIGVSPSGFSELRPLNNVLTEAPKPTASQKRSLPAKKVASAGRWKQDLGKDDLAACVRHGTVELIRRIAAEGADLSGFRNSDEETLLFIACKEGRLEIAQALLDLGLEPNALDRRKSSILSKICNRWNVRPKPEIVRLLLDGGADPTLYGTLTPAIFDRCGYALPMIGCAIDSYLDCAQVLFEKEKTVNHQQPGTLLTPLMCVCHRKHRNSKEERSLEFAQWLMQCGAETEMRSERGLNAMEFALGVHYLSGHAEPHLDDIASPVFLRFLYDSGARPSERYVPILNRMLGLEDTSKVEVKNAKGRSRTPPQKKVRRQRV